MVIEQADVVRLELGWLLFQGREHSGMARIEQVEFNDQQHKRIQTKEGEGGGYKNRTHQTSYGA